MKNLWPVDLLSEPDSSGSDWDLIEAQAVAISQATKGLVQGEIRRRDRSIGRSASLFLYPAYQPMKGYEFMAIRSPGEALPLALEVFHLGESQRIWRVDDLDSLKGALLAIFSHRSTSRIIRTLAREAEGAHSLLIGDENAEVAQTEDDLASDANIPSTHASNELSRPIAVGGLIRTDKKSFATVTLLGIAGFVSEDELKRLVMKSDTRGSAVNALNDRFVVTVAFLDRVKIVLSVDELKVLRNEVQKALSGEAKH